MKIKNAFPVDSMSGTLSGSNEKNYYQFRNIQVMRKKGGNSASPSKEFADNTIQSRAFTQMYNSLSSSRQIAWNEYAKEMSRLIGRNKSNLNAYTAFKNVNYFGWWIGLVGWKLDPPEQTRFLSISFQAADVFTLTPHRLRLRFVITGQDEFSYIYLKTTQPHKNFIHAWRRSEIKPIEQYQSTSCLWLGSGSNPFEYETSNSQYEFGENNCFFIEAVAIGPFQNVSKPYKFSCISNIF